LGENTIVFFFRKVKYRKKNETPDYGVPSMTALTPVRGVVGLTNHPAVFSR